VPKKKKQEVVVSIQSSYYKIDDSFCNVTEEDLFELDPMAETKVCVALEKGDDFVSNVESLLDSDYFVPGDVEKDCDVCYTIMCFDDEVVYKFIQKVNLFGDV
jgi:hypothetical protein